MFSRYIQDLRREFSGYDGKKLSADLMAGVTVAAVALPLALAFGVSAGADAAAGLITAIVSGILIGALSGASFQISGPTGAMSAVLVTVVARYGLEGMFLVTLIAGMALVAMGLLKVGRMVSIIPLPVLTGFTSGIAVIIALGQVDNLFGTVSQGDSAVEKLLSYGQLGFSPHMHTLAIGLAVIGIMLLWPKGWQRVCPSSLAAIVLVTAVNLLVLRWEVAVVGEIPRTLLPQARLHLGSVDLSQIEGLLAPALSIAALSMLESLLSGATGGRMKGETMNADRELVAQGIGNMVLPFFGGLPTTSALARTSVAVKAGQQTRLTSVFHSLTLLLSMFLLGPIIAQIPMAALAGVLMVTAWRMNEWRTIRYLFGSRLKAACAGFLVTMACTVVFDLTVAILAGVAFSAVMFTVKVSGTVEVTVTQVDPQRLALRDMAFHEAFHQVRVAYVTGALFFGSAGLVRDRLETGRQGADALILSLRGLGAIDSTGAHVLLELCRQAAAEGVRIYFTGVQNQVMDFLRRGGVVAQVGEENFLWSTEQALERLAEGPLSTDRTR